ILYTPGLRGTCKSWHIGCNSQRWSNRHLRSPGQVERATEVKRMIAGPTKSESTRQSDAGFSLIELLIVVAIIGIIAAIAIPNLLASRRAANEASAQSSLRTIHSCQITYFATIGGSTYADIPTLRVQLLTDSVLGTGTKSGYGFVANPTAPN